MRTLINLVVILLIGLTVGGLVTQFSIRQSHGIGAINVGPWSAWPFVGGAEIDPYTAARATADGTLPLGAAEGLAFEAAEDQSGAPLLRECSYVITGNTPPTRFWTLSAYTRQGEWIRGSSAKVSAIHSGKVTRFPDGSFTITLGNDPAAGNWVSMAGAGPFKLILRLYDTPITSNSGVIDPEMPKIERKGCPS